MRFRRLLVVVAISATVLTACGDDDDPVETGQPTTSSSLSPTSTAQPAPILLRDFSFFGLEVKAGSKLLVQNTGQQPHSLTAEDGRFDTGQVQPGRNVEFTVPSQVGTYRIRCVVHPDRMAGELKVS
ncbi:MAG TPA: cupredoxin domain-containing protein [Acidimicrobiales bacterium]|nr:cupredoxin domain-containing protein [Acidimicrobiales bacterium]